MGITPLAVQVLRTGPRGAGHVSSALSLVVLCAAAGDAQATATLQERPEGPSRWALEAPDIRIGSYDDPERMLTTVPHLFVHGDRLFVAQPQRAQVNMHDLATGALLRRLGREGRGPGEFLNPNWIGAIGDTIWVNDGNLARMTLFSPEGEYLTDRRHPESPPAPGGGSAGFGMLTAEGGYLYSVSFTRDPTARLPTFAVDPTGETHLLAWRTGLPRQTFATSDGAFQVTSHRFWTMTTWAPDPEGRSIALAERGSPDDPDGARYDVIRVTMGGDTLFSTAVPYEPVRIPSAVLDSLPDDTPDEYAPVLGWEVEA